MRNRRASEGFNLSFLDIMSCGLGAVILVFMLVKHNVSTEPVETVDTKVLEQDLARLEQQEKSMKDALTALERTANVNADKISQIKAQVAQLDNTIQKQAQSLEDKKGQLSALKQEIKSTPRAQTEDVITDDQGGEESYLMGLRVEGTRIAILLDTSASMTDENLIDIIRRKNGTANDKKQGPKWQRTVKIIKWLLARAPRGSQVSIIAYSETAAPLDQKNWFDPKNPGTLKAVYQSISQVVPNGATNLEKALQEATRLNPTDLYVVTDGLPTVGESQYASLNPFAECRSLLGKATRISGACRVKLFRHSVNQTALKTIRINVILLPLEGDPDAANEYWSWSSSSGGLLISPAKSWP